MGFDSGMVGSSYSPQFEAKETHKFYRELREVRLVYVKEKYIEALTKSKLNYFKAARTYSVYSCRTAENFCPP